MLLSLANVSKPTDHLVSVQLDTNQVSNIATCIANVVTAETLLPASIRSAALTAANALLQSTSHSRIELPVSAASSLLSALAVVSDSNHNDAVRGVPVVTVTPSHAEAVLTAVGQLAAQMAIHSDANGNPLIISSESIQIAGFRTPGVLLDQTTFTASLLSGSVTAQLPATLQGVYLLLCEECCHCVRHIVCSFS